MKRVRKPDGPPVICEDCGKTRAATQMIQLSSAWLCRECWLIDIKNNGINGTQEVEK